MKEYIDQLEDMITSPDQMDGSELFVVSQPNASANTGFETKKMTLNTLNQFIHNTTPGGGGGSASFGGSIIYDSVDTDNYVYKTLLRTETGIVHFEKTVTKDCLVCIAAAWSSNEGTDNRVIVKLDGYEIFPHCFAGGGTSAAKICVKSGQKIEVDRPSSTSPLWALVSVIPLRSGGVFIDTNQHDKFINGGSFAPNSHFVFTAERPTLLNIQCTSLDLALIEDNSSIGTCTWNGRKVFDPVPYNGSNGLSGSMSGDYSSFVLEAGDKLCVQSYGNHRAGWYGAYPILV